MATAKEYFEKARGRYLSVHLERSFTFPETGDVAVTTSAVSVDFEGNNKIAFVYVPDAPNGFAMAAAYLRDPELLMAPLGDWNVTLGTKGTDESISLKDLGFTGRVFLYTPQRCSTEEEQLLKNIASERGLFLIIRDAQYVAARNLNERPEAFISYDSRDKEIAGRIANGLLSIGRNVWYDEYSLIAGQSLRASIEKGIKECHKCVVIFSRNFFANGGWTLAEFDSVFTREIVEQKRLIVPIWHGVTRKEVYDYCPRMADIVGIISELENDELMRRIGRAIDMAGG